MEILQMPMYVYIVIVSSLEKQNFDYPFTIVLAYVATLLLTPFFFFVYFCFFTYKKLIVHILRKCLPDTFIDLMEGLDSICCNQINCTPNVLLLVDTADNLQTLYNKTLTLVKCAMHSEHKKLFYSRGFFMGYHYFYKNHLKPQDYILVTKDECVLRSRSELSEAFKLYDNHNLPDNGHALLQVILFRGHFEHGNNELKLVAFRLHHCLGDGKAIMNLFVSVFGDVELIAKDGSGKRKYSDIPLGKLTPEIKRLKEWPTGLHDDNPLRGYHLSEDKHIAWFSDTNKDCMNKIRLLRRSLQGVTFLDVVNTCISSSLYDYYERHEMAIPETVIAGVVLSPAIYSFSYGVGSFTMSNRFSCAGFHMPIGYGDCKLATRLRHIKKEYDMIKRCVDVQFNYWTAQHICETIPAPIVRVICEYVPITFGVSSLPGCEQFTLFSGSPVKDFIFMLPNSPRCGLHFVIYTYGGNFRFALTADKSVIPTHHEAQTIVDGVIAYLDEMHRLCVDGKLIL